MKVSTLLLSYRQAQACIGITAMRVVEATSATKRDYWRYVNARKIRQARAFYAALTARVERLESEYEQLRRIREVQP